ncbi:MAG: hypothetical protein CSA33_08870 [Desulfobulbus propionicus]|nr:MAG: hypothetical protein CSA33_08870 [Desulfobulbus propionicus]
MAYLQTRRNVDGQRSLLLELYDNLDVIAWDFSSQKLLDRLSFPQHHPEQKKGVLWEHPFSVEGVV